MIRHIEFCKDFNAGFTLAEVLITLGIIGVVASITMPLLIQNYKERQTVVQLNKAYSTLSQAVLLAQNKNGPIEEWDLAGFFKPDGAKNLIDILTPHLNIVKNCSNNDNSCMSSQYYYPDNKPYMNLSADTRTGKAVLADGSILMVRTRSQYCNEITSSNNPNMTRYCAWILYDLNGKKGPNALGRDTFSFNLFASGIYPAGLPDDDILTFDELCKDISSSSGSRGFGCTGWVVVNKNMDYLHCKDLDWNNKTKCKG